MKRSVKILLAVLALVLVAGGVGLGFALGRGNGSNIAQEEALNIALDQAGLSKSDVDDIDIELERRRGGNARYEVDFEYLGTDYDCLSTPRPARCWPSPAPPRLPPAASRASASPRPPPKRRRSSRTRLRFRPITRTSTMTLPPPPTRRRRIRPPRRVPSAGRRL